MQRGDDGRRLRVASAGHRGLSNENVARSRDRTATALPSRRPGGYALLGLLLVVAGVVGYFVIVLSLDGRLPSIRNHPLPNWLLVAAGVALSVLAVRRAPPRRRVVPSVVLGVNLLLAGAFAAFLHVLLRVPAAPGPPVGSVAHDFALADQAGQIRRLADYAGKPLLLVFYRGHW
jgi:hypothetical protein